MTQIKCAKIFNSRCCPFTSRVGIAMWRIWVHRCIGPRRAQPGVCC